MKLPYYRNEIKLINYLLRNKSSLIRSKKITDFYDFSRSRENLEMILLPYLFSFFLHFEEEWHGRVQTYLYNIIIFVSTVCELSHRNRKLTPSPAYINLLTITRARLHVPSRNFTRVQKQSWFLSLSLAMVSSSICIRRSNPSCKNNEIFDCSRDYHLLHLHLFDLLKPKLSESICELVVSLFGSMYNLV